MGWTDDLGDSDWLLGLFGLPGLVVLAVVCCLYYCQHRDVTYNGVKMEIVAVGTCKDGDCVIKVKQGDGTLERTTGSSVFVGDVVMCGKKRCYKD